MDDFVYKQPQRFRITNRQRDEEKRRKSGSSGGIPDRWLDYLGVHSWVENTRFVPFKCPLKPALQKHLADDRRFTLGDLVEQLDDKGKELGLIVDLTNTNRYYSEQDILDAQIQYFKMMTPGHNQIPNDKCYEQFVDVVKKFLDENKNNEKLIGVHCTHGLNRTGYLIVRYMIEYMDFEPSEALEAFNRARGHSMEKYTEDLLKRTSLSQKSQTASATVYPTTPSTAPTEPNTNNNNTSGGEVKWPTLYSGMANISLDERNKHRQQKSGSIPVSTSMYEYRNPVEETRTTNPTVPRYENKPFDLQGRRGRTANYQRQATNNNNNNTSYLYRQTSVTPHILNATYDDNQHSIQTSSAYFGSGSNVGRGRPMTGDR